jgi:protein phosphatase 1G
MGAAMTYLDEPETEKDVCDGGSMEKDGARYGVCGMQGWRRNMEDAHIAVSDFDHDVGLYGVFDGHGGKAVSRFVAKEFSGLLKANEAYKRRDYKKALEETFIEVDVRLRAPEGRAAVKELDQPEPGKSQKPIVLPKAMVQRFMGQHSSPSFEVQDEAEGAEPDEEVTDAAAGEKTSDEKSGSSPSKETKESTSGAGDSGAAEGDDEDEDVQIQLVSEDAEEEEDGGIEGSEDVEDEMDEELVAISPAALSGDATPEAQGCTAVVVMVVRSKDGEGPRLYCANAGDSRAVMSRRGAVLALSEDHKPECPQEVARITKAGGHVQMDAPGGPRVQGDLNLSRAFGDLRYKTGKELAPEAQILTAFPEVRVLPLTDEDEFMVIGCDGIWEMVSNQEIVNFVRPKLKEILNSEAGKATPLSSICADICDRGLCPSMDQTENPSFDGHGCDNMTVTIVQLKPTITGEVDAELTKATAEAERRAGIAAGRIPEVEPEEPAAKRQKCEASSEGEGKPGANSSTNQGAETTDSSSTLSAT